VNWLAFVIAPVYCHHHICTKPGRGRFALACVFDVSMPSPRATEGHNSTCVIEILLVGLHGTYSFALIFLFPSLRSEIPYVFEVPTTLEALHDMIANYATTGQEVSLIIQRIHKANSVRLDRRNQKKMQNFYDVLIRRFVLVGDAISKSGDGGEELCRYAQLDVLTQVLYAMAQDAPECAGAVWSRRLGILQSAHAKRLRDAAMERDQDEDEEFSAWPSTGTFLALRSIGHIFPVTDRRHYIGTPTILFLGQILSQTPVLSRSDLVLGMICCGIQLEYTKDAKRVAPEAHAFLASVIRLFAPDCTARFGSLPTLYAASGLDEIASLRKECSAYELDDVVPLLSLESNKISNGVTPAAILLAALHLVEISVNNLEGSVSCAEREVFAEITDSILALRPKLKSSPLPAIVQAKIKSVASTLSSACDHDAARAPLRRRAVAKTAIKSLAPRLENPERYSMSKDKGKNATQAAADRTRREYKREHKAVSRELRLDGALVEQERRKEQHKRDSAAKAKRQKAFAWMEGEQAIMNQQVRQGGGLLKGGGIGAAKAKASSAKLGMKKGGKL
jgi:nucleolar protein 14